MANVNLYVDVDALSELSRQLQQVKASLEHAEDGVSSYEDEGRLGSSRIQEALDDFIDGWRDGRKKIIEGIDGLLGRIQGAIDTYNQQEENISKATQTDTAEARS